jgi:arabinofuranosyltransferase
MAATSAVGPLRRPATVASFLAAAFSTLFIVRASFTIDGRRYFALFDDAMISMRYARMLAEGHGLAWNAGGPRVEGYTNFLWTLWMAALHLTHAPERLMSLLVSISGVLVIVATIHASASVARRLAGDGQAGLAAGLAAFFVAFCYPVLFWTLRGMEVGLLAWLILVAVDNGVRLAAGEDGRRWRLAAALALMALVRADAVVPAVAIALCTTAARLSRGSDPGPIPTALLIAVPLLTFALHTAFRGLYYGSLLPNTYYLKMTGIPLSVRIGRGLATTRTELWSYLALPLVAAAANRRIYRNPAHLMVLAVPVALIAYSAWAGGDAWEWIPVANRYIASGLPLLLAGAAVTLAQAAGLLRARPRLARLLAIAGAILVAYPLSAPGFREWMRTGGSHIEEDATMVTLGVRVAQTTSPSTRIGVVWAGAIPYFAHREAIDFLGKNDPVIAKHAPVLPFYPGHDRFDYAYSVGVLKPDLILQLWFPTDQTLRMLADAGYDQVFGGVYVRRGAEVDVERLRAFELEAEQLTR